MCRRYSSGWIGRVDWCWGSTHTRILRERCRDIFWNLACHLVWHASCCRSCWSQVICSGRDLVLWLFWNRSRGSYRSWLYFWRQLPLCFCWGGCSKFRLANLDSSRSIIFQELGCLPWEVSFSRSTWRPIQLTPSGRGRADSWWDCRRWWCCRLWLRIMTAGSGRFWLHLLWSFIFSWRLSTALWLFFRRTTSCRTNSKIWFSDCRRPWCPTGVIGWWMSWEIRWTCTLLRDRIRWNFYGRLAWYGGRRPKSHPQ